MKRKKVVVTLLIVALNVSLTQNVLAEENVASINEALETENTKSELQDAEESNTELVTAHTNANMTGSYQPSTVDKDVPEYNSEISAYSNLPASYPDDMKTYNQRYPDNRNQNPYGTCWAFSSIGLAEFDLINDGNFDKSIDLSELQLAYFTFNSVKDPLGGTEGDYAKYYNENTSTSYLNYGGNYEMAARRMAQWVGNTKDADVPYKNAASTVTNGLADEYAYNHDVAHLENAYAINLKSNVDDVKQNIMEHGAAGVMYYHEDNAMLWNSDKSLWTYYDTSKTGGGHAVMLVGWDDNFSKDNFVGTAKPENNGAWLVRNSWGMYCNYFWMSYESASLGDAAWIFDCNANEQYDNNYQCDGGLSTYPATYNTVSNVYQVDKKEGVASETLRAVSISSMHAAGVNYTVDIYTNLKNKNDPLSGEKQEMATTTGTIGYAGIYSVPLENPVELTSGSSYAVVVTVDKQAIDYEQAIRIEDFDTNKTIWDCAISLGNGKSFFKSGNKFYQWYWGNYCIKAFTTNNESEKHSITYVLNGGTNHPDNVEYYENPGEEVQLHEPTRIGYKFEGWYLDTEYKQRITSIPANSSEDYTVYARWELCPKETTNGKEGIYEAGDGNWYYFKNDTIQSNVTDVMESKNGLNGWYYIKNGKLQKGQITVEQNKNGWWYIDKNGKVDFSFNGLAANNYGVWYCEKGKVQFQKTSVVESKGEYKGWYYVKKGQLQLGHVTVEQNKNGWWYIDKNGKVDFSFNGLAANAHGIWYCQKSQVKFEITSVVESKGEYNGWYYVKKGELQKGQITVEQNPYGWWYIDKNGKVDFRFTGIAKNPYGNWYIEKGKVDFKKNMDRYVDPHTGFVYKIEKGKATISYSGNVDTVSLLNTQKNTNITTNCLLEKMN